MGFDSLSWGVKASFRGYVEGAGGSITLGDGATRAQDGTFVLPALPGGDLVFAADGSASGSMRFKGSVEFEAHGGMLKATLNELGVEVTEEGLVLTVLEAPLNQDRCAIATLTVLERDSGDGVTLGAQITMDGMYQIADNYPPGTELDELHLA
ncbi:MAG: HtaA domain-containing protein [Pseudomonadota bacterium]